MRHEVLLSFSLSLILSPSPPLSLQHVPLTEFLHKRFMKPDTSPMLKRVVQLSLRISRMVMMEVLRLPELPARTAMFEHILCVAQCLKDLNNFEGVCEREGHREIEEGRKNVRRKRERERERKVCVREKEGRIYIICSDRILFDSSRDVCCRHRTHIWSDPSLTTNRPISLCGVTQSLPASEGICGK